jgi:hypothetical protein
MSNYIGKISAIVTANTSDLSRKLGGARNEVNAFGRAIQSSIGSANRRASQSFNDIFTPLQRLQRALAAANRNPLDLRIDTTKVRELSDAANGLARPLAAAAKQFDQLGASVQQAFGPALSRAQGEVLDVQGFIEKFGRVSDETFVRVQRRVLDAATALNQLSQAQQRLNSLATGNELEFSDPRLAGNLAAAQRAGQNALSLSPGQIQADPQIEKLVRDIGELSQRATAAAANVKNIRLSGGDTRAAQAQFDDINDELGLLISRLNKKYTLVVDTEAAKKNAREIREALAFSITGRARNFDQLTSQLQAARGEVEKFDAVQRRAFAKDFGRLAAIIETNDVTKLQEASVILGRINALIGARKQYDIDTEESDSALQRLQERLGSIAESLRRTPSDVFDRLEQSANEARAAIDKVADARARASLNRRAAIVEGGIRADAANPALTDADRRRRAGLDAAALGAIGRDAAESDRRARDAAISGNVNKEGVGASARTIDRIGPSVTALRGQLNGLAEPLRASIGPEVDKLQTKFQLLARAGVAQSAEEVQRLKGEIAGLNAALSSRQSIGRDFLKSFGGAGSAGLSLGVDERSLRAIGGQIEFVQARLASLGQEARGPVLAALERLRIAAERLFRDGALDTAEGRAELDALRKDLVRVGAAAEGIRPGKFGDALKRAGDVARGSFSNFGLAVQQAAFIFDDFFSVTGGLDQRLRAIGNNISQLGFVLGGTAGLVAGVAASVTSQLLVALVNWQNGGAGTEDQVKSLNDALARQKSLVESLAQAYQSVADAIERSGFTQETQGLRERAKLIDDIRRKQSEITRSRIADLDPAVQRERGIQAARQRELDNAVDPGERVRLAREIAASRDRERAAADAAVARPAANAQQIAESVAAARLRVRESQINAAAAAAQSGTGPGGANAEIERRRREQIDQARAAAAEFAAAQGARLAGIRDPRQRAAAAVELIDQQQAEITSQITTGIQGFFDGANAARRQELARLERERATVERDVFSDASNDLAVQGIEQALDVSSAIGRSLELLGDAIGSGTSQIASDLERANQSLLDAESRLSAAAESGNLDAAEAARREIEATAKAVAGLESLARSTASFAEALDRVSNQLANTVAQEARSAADQARREANAAIGRGAPGDDADFRARRRDRLEQNAALAEDDRERIRRLNEDFTRAVASGALGGQPRLVAEQRDQALRDIEAATRRQDGDAVAEARRRLDVAESSLARLFESTPGGIAARELSDRADIDQQRRQRRDDLITRGRELSRSPGQAAGRELAESIRAINAGFEDSGGRDGDRLEAIARVRDEALRQQAPAIFNLADQVANAVLQGPSRAALQATDASTVEGANELNRLLRGDDAARNQDLVQLQREANRLLQVIAEAQAGVAN